MRSQEIIKIVTVVWALAWLPAVSGLWLSESMAQEPGKEHPAARDKDPFVRISADIRPSIVAVGTYERTDAPTIRYMGTGFVVTDGRTVITNAHVVEAVKKADRLEKMRVFFPDMELPNEGRAVTLAGQDAFHDVAILRFQGPAAPALELKVDGDAPLQGQSVGIMGYPLGTALGLVPAVHKGVIAAVVPAVLPLPRGTRMTPELAEGIRRPYNLYQLDMVVFPGNSGSPVFDAQTGRVLGIINKTLAVGTREHLLSEPSGIAYAVPLRWAHELWVRVRADLPPQRELPEAP